MGNESRIRVEVDGVSALIDSEAIASMDFLEHLYDLEDGDVSAVVPIARAMFGRVQWGEIKRTLKREHGDASAQRCGSFALAAIRAAADARRAEAKN